MFGQAEQEIRARDGAAAQFREVAQIDADREPIVPEHSDGLLQMRKGEAGFAADVDDVGAVLAQRMGTGAQGVHRQRRRIDDLGEDADVVAREIRGGRAVPEKARQVHDFVGAAREGQTERLGQTRRVHPGPAGQDHAGRRQRSGQPAQDDRLGH